VCVCVCARVRACARAWAGAHVLYIVYFVSFCVLFVCKCVLYYCHRVATQLQLTNMLYHIYCSVVNDEGSCLCHIL
jgi:hypothetical protein